MVPSSSFYNVTTRVAHTFSWMKSLKMFLIKLPILQVQVSKFRAVGLRISGTSFTINSFRWHIRGERPTLSFRQRPHDPKTIDRREIEEKTDYSLSFLRHFGINLYNYSYRHIATTFVVAGQVWEDTFGLVSILSLYLLLY